MFLKNSNIHIFVNDNTNIWLINILSFANFNYIIYNEHRRLKKKLLSLTISRVKAIRARCSL